MWAGCYSLDLYCDHAQGSEYREEAGKLVDAAGHEYGEFPHSYTGEHGSECRSRARQAGWIIRLDGSAVCPKCSGKAVRRKPRQDSDDA